MSKKIVILVLIVIYAVSFTSRFHEPEAVNTFKVESVGIRM